MLLACVFARAQHAATFGRLCPVHRLDRNVSGLLVFARGAAAANALRIQIMVRGLVLVLLTFSAQPLAIDGARTPFLRAGG